MDQREDRERGILFEKHRENIYFRWGLTAFTVIVACVIVAWLVFQLPAVIAAIKSVLRILAPVIYGLGIAYLLDPIACRIRLLIQPLLEKRWPDRAAGLSRGIGILASLVMLVLLVWALLAMILPQLLGSIQDLIPNLSGYYETIQAWIAHLTENSPEIGEYVNNALNSLEDYLNSLLTLDNLMKLQGMFTSLTSSVVAMAKVLLNLVIGLIISIYLLLSKEKFLAQAKKLLYALLGNRRAGYVCNVCTFANRAFGGFIGGKIIDSIIIGVLCFIGLSVLRMPYALLISIIVGVTNIIPFFGPYLGAVPSALLLLVISPVKALTFIIFILILQQLDGNVIGPLILGDATGLSSFWVVVSILIFGGLWGVPGMVVAVPLFAVIYKVISEIVNRLLLRRGLSTVTEDYQRWNYPPRQEADHWKPAPARQKRNLGRQAVVWLRTRSTDTPLPEEPEDGAQEPPSDEM